MKTPLLTMFISVFPLLAAASGTDTAKVSYPAAQLSIGLGTGPAFGSQLPSLGIGAGVMLNPDWTLGIRCFLAGRRLAPTAGYLARQPGLSLVSVGGFGAYDARFSRRSSLAVSVLAGLTSAVLQDRAESKIVYNGKSSYRKYKSVEWASFLFVQPSLTYAYRLNHTLRITASARYDYNQGRTKWVAASDFNGLRGDLGIVATLNN